VDWGELDYLIIDLPPGTGDAQLTLAQSVPLTGAIIVTTPQDVALGDAVKGLAMFQQLQVPIIGIVENMGTFVCPNCGHPTDIFGTGGGARMAARLGVPFLGSVPIDPRIREGGDNGKPIVAIDPDVRPMRCARSRAMWPRARLSISAKATNSRLRIASEAQSRPLRPSCLCGRILSTRTVTLRINSDGPF
jgi:ATP-binding protein involved in chromosome partitioning